MLVITPRWGSEDGLDRFEPSPLGWAEEARAVGPEVRNGFRSGRSSLASGFRREVGLRPKGAALPQPRAPPWVAK